MNDYSEFDMANVFLRTLKNNEITRLPEFEYVFREALCQQGVADFICLNFDGNLNIFNTNNISSVENCVQVLSLLKRRSGRSFEYFIKKNVLSKKDLERTFREMLNNGYIKKEGKLFYRCIPDIAKDVNVWAFELKLNNWKRAIFQSLQYKSIANYSVVVFPFEKKKLLIDNLHFFVELNIGVLLFDLNSKCYKWINYPKKEKAFSQWNAFCTLAKLVNKHNEKL